MSSTSDEGRVTQLLNDLSAGREAAFDELLPEVLTTLRGIARHRLRAERPGHTLNTTALVHEAYLKLVHQGERDWRNRTHFFAVASRAMRHILISYARSRNAEKRGGGAPHVSLEDHHALLTDTQAEDLDALNEALELLEQLNPRHVRVVECRFFGGLNVPETAEALGISTATVVRDWRMARAWLRHTLSQGDPPATG